MKRKLIALVLTILLAGNFIQLPMSYAAPFPQGQGSVSANISHNWVQLHNVPRSSNPILSINRGGQLIGPINFDNFNDYQNQNNPNMGNYMFELWDNNIQLSPGDILTITPVGNDPVVMTVDPQINAQIDHANNVVSGRISQDRDWRIDIFPNDDYGPNQSQPYSREGHSGNGAVNENFSAVYDIKPANEAWLHSYQDNKRFETIVVVGSPKINANISDNEIEVWKFSANTNVKLKINDNNNLQFNKTTDENGNTRFNGNDFGQGFEVKSGDNLKIFENQNTNPSAEMYVSNIAGTVNSGADTVTGTITRNQNPPANSTVRVELDERPGLSWEMRHRDVNLDNNGNFIADYKLNVPDDEYDPYDLKVTDEPWVNETDNNTGNQTSFRVGTPKITAHVSDNWLQVEHLIPGTSYKTKINNNPNLDFDNNSSSRGSIELNGDDLGDYQIKPGDDIQVFQNPNNQSAVARMQVSDVSAQVNTTTHVVSGSVLHGQNPAENSFIGVEVTFPDNGTDQQRQRDTNTLADGNFSANFQLDTADYDPYILTAKSQIEVSEQDPLTANETRINTGTPKLKANVSHNWIEGNFLPRNRNDLRLEVKNQAGILLFNKTDLATNFNGFFNFNLGDNNRNPLNIGDQIKVYDGTDVIASMSVSNLSVEPRYQGQGNKVEGDAPSGTEVIVRIDENNPINRTTNNSGRYDTGNLSFSLNKLNNIWVENYDNNGNQTIRVKAPTRLKVNLSHSWFEAQGLFPGQNYEVEIMSGSQTPPQGPFIVPSRKADHKGNIHLDSWRVGQIINNEQFSFNFGDSIKVKRTDNSEIVAQMQTASPFTVNITNPNLNDNQFSVFGQAPPGSYLKLDIQNLEEWNTLFDTDLDVASDGNYIVPFSQELGSHQGILATSADSEQNETILISAMPRLHIWDYGSIEGMYFPPNTSVDVKVGEELKNTANVDIKGRFNVWEQIKPDGKKEPLALSAEQILTVNKSGGGAQLLSWLLPNLTGKINLDVQPNKVTGSAPNGEVKVRFAPWWSEDPNQNGPSKDVQASGGQYEAIFTQQLTRKDWGKVSINDQNQNELNVSIRSSSIRVNIEEKTIALADFDKGANYTLLRSRNGVQDVSQNFTTDPNGEFEYQLQAPATIEAGDVITIKQNTNTVNEMVAAKLENPTANAGQDTISGKTESDADVSIELWHNEDFDNPDEQAAWGETENSTGQTGNFNIPMLFGEDEKYDVGADEDTAWVHINVNNNETVRKFFIHDTVGPVINNLTSPTHPDSNIFSNNDQPRFKGQIKDGSALGGCKIGTQLDPPVFPVDSFFDITYKIDFGVTSPSLVDGTNTFKFECQDEHGYWSNVYNYSVKIDKTKPIDPLPVNISSSTHGGGAWTNNNQVRMNWSGATDPDIEGNTASGLDGYSVLLSINQNDVADNAKEVSHTAGLNTWTSQPLGDGEWYFTLKTGDKANNWTSTVKKGPYRVDVNPPVTTAQLSGNQVGDNYTGAVQVTLNASDGGGSGIGSTKYKIDGGAEQLYIVGPIIVGNEASHNVQFYSTDNTGKIETTKSVQFTIKFPPPPAPAPQNPGPQSPTPPAPTPGQSILSTLLSLNASPKAITAGKAVTIKGQLKGSNGAPVAGKRVTIKADGKVIKTVTTNAGGSFSFKHKPKKNTTYQATFIGDGGYSTSSSKAAKVSVKKAKKKIKKKKK